MPQQRVCRSVTVAMTVTHGGRRLEWVKARRGCRIPEGAGCNSTVRTAPRAENQQENPNEFPVCRLPSMVGGGPQKSQSKRGRDLAPSRCD